MAVLTKADHEFWDEHGYIVVKRAVPQPQLDAVVEALWEFLEMDPERPAGWHARPPWHSAAGMVELYHHQALWDTRQHPRVHEAYSDLFGRPDLWVRLDRVNMNPPVDPANAYPGFIHWDFDPETWPIPLKVQGVLYLTDTTAEQGGFQCIPGTHKRVDEILAWQEPGQNLRHPDIHDLEIQPIPGAAGDLVIWHTALLHGNGPNLTARPRLAQYIAMMPAENDDEGLRRDRIRSWRRRLPMGHMQARAFPADPRKRDENINCPARLTALGRRLLGLELW